MKPPFIVYVFVFVFAAIFIGMGVWLANLNPKTRAERDDQLDRIEKKIDLLLETSPENLE